MLEGAGSPAEINLQDEDFVNTAMAEYADAACVLVADINPGGVFASIYGTIRLIPARRRHLIKGIIINKFRGDESLLDSGLKDIERLTGIPVLKVMPYIHRLAIEEEDGMALESKKRGFRGCEDKSSVDIVVVRLPRISNFTDFMVLENTPGVSLRYVSDPKELGKPDLIVIPGTKNTIGDMRFLRESGFEARLRSSRNSRIPIFGICGGYQMLGTLISDPDGVEGEIREIRGLGFLPVDTVLTQEKKLSRIVGETLNLPFVESGSVFEGYEIHMGETTRAKSGSETADGSSAPIIITRRGEKSVREFRGSVSNYGLVFGCYAHGFFDLKSIREPLIAWLAERSPDVKRPPETGFDPVAERERSFDLLANHLANAADSLLAT